MLQAKTSCVQRGPRETAGVRCDARAVKAAIVDAFATQGSAVFAEVNADLMSPACF
jgi:hypothetical protein